MKVEANQHNFYIFCFGSKKAAWKWNVYISDGLCFIANSKFKPRNPNLYPTNGCCGADSRGLCRPRRFVPRASGGRSRCRPMLRNRRCGGGRLAPCYRPISALEVKPGQTTHRVWIREPQPNTASEYENRNLLECSLAVAQAAYRRRQNIGAHFNSDC